MLIQAQVGPAVSTTSLGAGTNPNLRLDNMGGLAATQLNPRYYETTYRRQAYTAATTSGVTTTVGTAVTYQGVFVGNPSTSTVNLVITKVGYAVSAAPAAAMVVGIMTGTGVGATLTNAVNTNIRNRFVSGIASQAIANVVAGTNVTLPTTPVLETVLGTIVGTTLATTTPNIVDLEGSLILPPGTFAAIYTSSASAATSFFGSMQWVEVPL